MEGAATTVLTKRKRGQGKRKDRDQATLAAYEATRYVFISGGEEQYQQQDWKAVVVCINEDLTECRQLRFPLVHKKEVDENGIGLLFALSLERDALQTPGCSGTPFDVTTMASVSLVQSYVEKHKEASTFSKEAARRQSSLASICPEETRPVSVAVHQGGKAVCSFQLELTAPLIDLNGDFWYLPMQSNKGTALLRLLISKRHRLPHAVEYFCVRSEMDRLLAPPVLSSSV